MTRALTRDLARTLRGAWSRRGTLAPLLALTTVVVAGVVAVLGFSEAAGTSGAPLPGLYGIWGRSTREGGGFSTAPGAVDCSRCSCARAASRF